MVVAGGVGGLCRWWLLSSLRGFFGLPVAGGGLGWLVVCSYNLIVNVVCGCCCLGNW